MQGDEGGPRFYKWADLFGNDSVEASMCINKEQIMYRDHGASHVQYSTPSAIILTGTCFTTLTPTLEVSIRLGDEWALVRGQLPRPSAGLSLVYGEHAAQLCTVP